MLGNDLVLLGADGDSLGFCSISLCFVWLGCASDWGVYLRTPLVQVATRASMLPRRSATMRLSSFKALRVVRAAMARYLLKLYNGG